VVTIQHLRKEDGFSLREKAGMREIIKAFTLCLIPSPNPLPLERDFAAYAE